MNECISIKVKDRIGHIILNRPEKLNSLSKELIEEIIQLLK